MRAFIKAIILGPIAIAAILLAVANRGAVRIVLDPFTREAPLAVDVPLYALMLGFLALGLVLGGFGTWLSQHRYRRAAKSSRREADRLRVENARLGAELAGRSERPGTTLPAPRAAA